MNNKQEWEDEYSAEAQGAAGKLIDGAQRGSLADWEEPQLLSTQDSPAQDSSKGKLDSASGSKPWVAGED